MTQINPNENVTQLTPSDMNIKRSLSVTARNLIRKSMTAALSTHLHEESWPYGSLVLAACTHDSTPLLLMSDLAEHTKSIISDNRVSLMYDGTKELTNPLSGPRVTVLGRAFRDFTASNRLRFLSRHPTASKYADFGDFGIYRVAVKRAHLVLGFGEIHWLDGKDLIWQGNAEKFVASEESLLLVLNSKYKNKLGLIAEKLFGECSGAWHAIGADPDGLDLKHGSRTTRINFSQPVTNPREIESKIVEVYSEILA